MRRNKKGNVNDIIFTGVILFTILIGIVVFFPVWDDVARSFNDSDTINQAAKDQLAPDINNLPNAINNLYVLVFFGAFASIIALAFVIRSNMMFVILAITVLAIFMFLTAVFSNIYQETVADDPRINAYVLEHFALSNHLLENYPLYVFIMGILILITLYAKTTGNVGSGL